MEAFRYRDGIIEAIDQGSLPHVERWLTLASTAQLARAITSLKIRGAPMLGIAGAFGVAQAAFRSRSKSAAGVVASAASAAEILKATRPTAINLGWAIDRCVRAGSEALSRGDQADEIRKVLLAEAEAIQTEDANACQKIAEFGQQFIAGDARVLTHCNTGFLVTGGSGTALGVIRLAHEQAKNIRVLVDETRPLLQGARLTAWELQQLGIPHEVIADAAAPALIAGGEVDVVIVGADRIASNGDTANKIGTYALALAANASGVPFVVAAPTSTFDFSIPSGAEIKVEYRNEDEVLLVLGRTRTAPAGTRARNPAFDVTPARLITAIVTERGVFKPSDVGSLHEN